MAEAGYDAIVVGSGAGGCAVAYRLVRAGKRVLLVEKGNALPHDGSTLDVTRVIHEGAFKSHEQWRRGDGRHVVPEEYFNLGGKTSGTARHSCVSASTSSRPTPCTTAWAGRFPTA
jgi:choline dehydrogenase-like flavoprotein